MGKFKFDNHIEKNLHNLTRKTFLRTEITRLTMDFKSTIFIFGAALIFIPPLIISSPTSGEWEYEEWEMCSTNQDCSWPQKCINGKCDIEFWTPCSHRNKETTGTCAFFNCYDYRGPTKCVDGKCICADDHYTSDGETCKPCPIKPGYQYIGTPTSTYKKRDGRICAGPTMDTAFSVEQAIIGCNMNSKCGCFYASGDDDNTYTMVEGTKTHGTKGTYYSNYKVWVKKSRSFPYH